MTTQLSKSNTTHHSCRISRVQSYISRKIFIHSFDRQDHCDAGTKLWARATRLQKPAPEKTFIRKASGFSFVTDCNVRICETPYVSVHVSS